MGESILIRADGSIVRGTGHVMRCLALAQSWKRAGGSAVFAQAETTTALQERVRQAGIGVVSLVCEPGSLEDAARTVDHARAIGASWVVADGYTFGATWQRAITSAGCKLLLWDDYGHADHYFADLILNQNASAHMELYPRHEDATRILLGSRFALLRDDFEAWRGWQREIATIGRKILVTLGGSDPENMTARVVDALAGIDNLEVIIVAGGDNPHQDALRSAIARYPQMRLISNAPNMAELMAWADLAVAAGGSTTSELAFMGLPSVLVVLAENQAAIARELDQRQVCHLLGDSASATTERMQQDIAALLAEPERRRQMSARGRELVDGYGGSRICAALGAKLRLTVASDADSWMNPFIEALKKEFEAAGHRVHWVNDPGAIGEGDIAFLLSLGRIVPPATLRRHAHNLVVHGSALPHGRGWSPLTWQVLEGKNEIPLTLLEAAAGVDSGVIYAQTANHFVGNELIHEMRTAQAESTLRLCREFVQRYPFGLADAREQVGSPSYYPRRRDDDSRLDPDKTIRDQFNLLRVADPDRYPAYFELAGRRYEIRLAASDCAERPRLSSS